MADEDTRTLEVRTQHEGLFRITIPAGWKVTFSKVNPQAGGMESCALRIYESDEKQRACFTNVTSFRCLSIPFERRVKVTKTRDEGEHGPKGSRSQREVEHEYEWTSEPDDDNGLRF